MTLATIPLFYFVDDVDNTNFSINFDEGGGELTGTVDVGSYSPEQLMIKIAKAMNSVAGQEYTVDFDRLTRLVTISATSNFSLLIGTGSNSGTSVFSLLGFTGGDLSGSNSYTASITLGYEYCPQFPLQDYIDPEHWQEKIGATTSESASGNPETVSFGTRAFYQFNIRFATNESKSKGNPIRNSNTGLDDLVFFMQFIIDKSPLEIMKDKDNQNVFDTIILESTSNTRDGTGYKIREMIRQKFGDHYESRPLTFRRI